MKAITSEFLARLQREVEPGEIARFESGETLIEFIPAKPSHNALTRELNKLRRMLNAHHSRN